MEYELYNIKHSTLFREEARTAHQTLAFFMQLHSFYSTKAGTVVHAMNGRSFMQQ